MTKKNDYSFDLDVISHHGILGMKWGVRRYQNEDGTLTAQGRERYNSLMNKAAERTKNSKEYKKAVAGKLLDYMVSDEGYNKVMTSNGQKYVDDALKQFEKETLDSMIGNDKYAKKADAFLKKYQRKTDEQVAEEKRQKTTKAYADAGKAYDNYYKSRHNKSGMEKVVDDYCKENKITRKDFKVVANEWDIRDYLEEKANKDSSVKNAIKNAKTVAGKDYDEDAITDYYSDFGALNSLASDIASTYGWESNED